MKKILIILTVLFMTVLFMTAVPAISFADTNVTLSWSANTENDMAGYRVYRGNQAGGPYTQVGSDVACGPNETACCELVDMGVPDGTYFWVATAYDVAGNESGYSNEVTDTLDSIAPAPPQELNVFKKIIAYIERHYMGYTVSITKTEPSG
jgi:hypothetical protein